jgi:uncharacterized protein YkwD
MHWNLVDLLLAVIVLAGAWAGWSRGFLFAALDLLTLAASLAAAFLGWHYVADWILRAARTPGVWIAPLSFLVLFLVVHFVLGTLVLRLLLRVPRRVHANRVNQVLGIAPGLVNGAVHAIVAAVLLLTLPLGARVAGWAHESALASSFAAPAEWVEAQMAAVFDPAMRRAFQLVIVGPERHEGVTLDFRVTQALPRPDLEAEMVDMVNAERRAAGLQPVRADPLLTEVARAHSQDMLARGYFSHYSPDGRDLEDRLRAAHIGYLIAGENLALASNLYLAHKGLMKSPGHRANILRPQFGRLGVGILDAGEHGLMVTQAYRN